MKEFYPYVDTRGFVYYQFVKKESPRILELY